MREEHGPVPIRTVADHFGLPLSTLHYWERRGLVTPSRRAGQRWYGTDELYRIALIKLWRGTGLIGLDRIADMLATGTGWQEAVTERIAEIEGQRAALEAAHSYLSHLARCPQPAAPEDCPEFRALVALPPG